MALADAASGSLRPFTSSLTIRALISVKGEGGPWLASSPSSPQLA